MSQERIKEIYKDYRNALKRLEEALNEDASKGSIVVDGTIQRFEFTFELSWKLIKHILGHQGISVNAPRGAVKEAFRTDIITDGESWIDMLEDRNKTSHIYDESEALKIYQRIKESYFKNLQDLEKSTAQFIK